MFRPGTWRWAAVTAQGKVLCRERGSTVSQAESEGLSRFVVQPVSQVGRMVLSKTGRVAGREIGLRCERCRVVLSPGVRLKNLAFTRRHVMASSQVGEEILVRYTWVPTGERVLVHIRPGQILVDAE